MSLSYVEDLAAAYYSFKGYIVSTNIRFQIPKSVSRKKISGWSDIDVLAIKSSGEVLIIQCKSFTGTGKSEEITDGLLRWFKNASHFLKNSDVYKGWLKGANVRNVLVVDFNVLKTEEALKKRGVEVILVKDMLKDILQEFKNKTGGKEDSRNEHTF